MQFQNIEFALHKLLVKILADVTLQNVLKVFLVGMNPVICMYTYTYLYM